MKNRYKFTPSPCADLCSPRGPSCLCLQAMDAGEYNYAIAFQERIKVRVCPTISSGTVAPSGTRTNAKRTLSFVFFRALDGAAVTFEAVGDRAVLFLSLSLTAYDLPVMRPLQVSDEKMKFYEELAEMYVGDDVSPDFYGWVFPKVRLMTIGTLA